MSNVVQSADPKSTPSTPVGVPDEPTIPLATLIVDKDERSNSFEALHWLIYTLLFFAFIGTLSTVHTAYVLSHRIYLVSIIVAAFLSIGEPFEWSNFFEKLVLELSRSPGTVLRIGNPTYTLESRPEEEYPNWKSFAYYCSNLLADIGGVTASTIGGCCHILINSLTFWFIQMDSMLTASQFLASYGQGSFFIARFWFGPNIIQTYNQFEKLTIDTTPPRYFLRLVVHVLLLIVQEISLIKNLLREYYIIS